MSLVTTTPYNTPKDISISDVINTDGSWTKSLSGLHHNGNIGSYIYIVLPALIEGTTYRVTYTISNYISCEVRVLLGTSSGSTRSGNGTYVENIVFTGLKRISFFCTGILDITSYKIEVLTTITTDTPLDVSTMRNSSWTLSYNPILNQWISFHSYLPNNFIQHPTKLIAKRNDTQLQLLNSGDYGKYFDEDIKPFILEIIANDNPLDTKVFDSITVNLDSSNGDINTNKFFDNGVLYNEYQCTGLITFDSTNLTKKERNWNFNKFTDLTNNTNNAIFVKDWNNVSTVYPIDKVINPTKIDNTKPWYQRGRMRDKYLAIRFIENNLENQKFLIKFVSCIYRRSER